MSVCNADEMSVVGIADDMSVAIQDEISGGIAHQTTTAPFLSFLLPLFSLFFFTFLFASS